MSRQWTHEELKALTKQMVDEGKLMEVGWLTLRQMVIPPEATEIEIADMRQAYMAGAQHLWSSILTVLDPDAAFLRRRSRLLRQIANELDAFSAEMRQRYKIPLPADTRPETGH